MIRILYIVPDLRSESGIIKVIERYVRALSNKEYTFDFLCYRHNDDMKADFEKLGANIFYFTEPTPYNLQKVNRELRDFFASHSYDILETHDLVVYYPIFRAARKSGTNCLVAHAHSTKFGETPLKSIRNSLLASHIAANSDALFACSVDAGRAVFGGRAIKSQKFEVIKNAVFPIEYAFDKVKRDKTRESLGLSDKFVIGHLGRFSRPKNQEFILEVFRRLHSKFTHAHLVLVGRGDGKSKILKKIIRYGLSDSVTVADSITDAVAFYSSLDVFVLPSKFEGLGNVAIEAQYNSLTVLASDRVPSEAKITEDMKFLPIIDYDVWINALEEEITGYKDREEVLIIESGYDMKVAAQKLDSIYSELSEKK